MQAADAEAVLRIYQQGCDTGQATFAASAGDWAAWDAGHLPQCRLIAEQGEAVEGWVALSAVSARHVYRGVAEVSLYITEAARGQGVGQALLKTAIAQSEADGFWTLQALIFPENTASLALFQKNGFRILATHEKLGLMQHGPMAGHWRDVALLERRSEVAGHEAISQ